jgi:hypothetical protein
MLRSMPRRDERKTDVRRRSCGHDNAFWFEVASESEPRDQERRLRVIDCLLLAYLGPPCRTASMSAVGVHGIGRS